MASAQSSTVLVRAVAIANAARAVQLEDRHSPRLTFDQALQCVCVALLVEQLDELEVALREAGGQS